MSNIVKEITPEKYAEIQNALHTDPTLVGYRQQQEHLLKIAPVRLVIEGASHRFEISDYTLRKDFEKLNEYIEYQTKQIINAYTK